MNHNSAYLLLNWPRAETNRSPALNANTHSVPRLLMASAVGLVRHTCACCEVEVEHASHGFKVRVNTSPVIFIFYDALDFAKE